MLLDVILDCLRFLDRDDLDVCQTASKSMRNFIEVSSPLAMRYIKYVKLVRTTGTEA